MDKKRESLIEKTEEEEVGGDVAEGAFSEDWRHCVAPRNQSN